MEDDNNDESDDNNTDDDKGVSKAMSTVFSLQGRLHLLVIHGILHLLE